ncbi:MAG: hypothetical protein ABEJ79_06875 [Halolamina sp.]
MVDDRERDVFEPEPSPEPEPVSTELEAFELTVSRVEPPRIDPPRVTEPEPRNADSQVAGGSVSARRAALVLYYLVLGHAAVLSVAVGGLLAVGRGRWTLGGKLLAAGAVLAAYVAYRYRHPPRLPGTRGRSR